MSKTNIIKQIKDKLSAGQFIEKPRNLQFMYLYIYNDDNKSNNKEGMHYLGIYVHAAGVTKVDAYSALNCKICLNMLLRVHPKGLRNEEKV